MSDNKSLTKIVNANLGKRVLAGIIDGLIALFVWLFLSLIVMRPILDSSLHYTDQIILGQKYQTASHLFVYQQLEDNGDVSTIEVKDYTEKLDSNKEGQILALANSDKFEANYYISHVHYYYTSYLTGLNVEMPNNTSSKTYDMVVDHFVSPDFEVAVDNILPKDKYTTRFVNEEILKVNSDGSAYFETSDINELAHVKEGLENDKDVIKFLRNVVNEASGDLYYRGYYQDINNTIKLNQVLLIVPPYVLVMLIFYLAIPLLFKDGETLGKKFLHLAVINKLGYTIKKRQTILRFFTFFLEISLSLFILGVGMTSIATLGIGILLLFLGTFIPKDHRSVHDFAAMTIVIDANQSVWFNSALEEERYNDELQKNMEKYKSVKVENPNIIQVGSTIVDENIKKELEEKKK